MSRSTGRTTPPRRFASRFTIPGSVSRPRLFPTCSSPLPRPMNRQPGAMAARDWVWPSPAASSKRWVVVSPFAAGRTWFRLLLQRLLPRQAIAENIDATERASLRGLRALIVDDNETNRKVLYHRLERWGVVNMAWPTVPPRSMPCVAPTPPAAL